METLLREKDRIQDEELDYLAQIILKNRGIEVGDDPRSLRAIAQDHGFLRIETEASV